MKKHDKATEDQSENFGCKYFFVDDLSIDCAIFDCQGNHFRAFGFFEDL